MACVVFKPFYLLIGLAVQKPQNVSGNISNRSALLTLSCLQIGVRYLMVGMLLSNVALAETGIGQVSSAIEAPSEQAEIADLSMASATEAADLKDIAVSETETDSAMVESDQVAREIFTATLPHNLSPWGMFIDADWVVKTVMIGLAIASLLTWTVLVAKSVELNSVKRRLASNLKHLTIAGTLDEAANTSKGSPLLSDVAREFIDTAQREQQLSAVFLNQEKANKEDRGSAKEGVKERVVSHISRIESAAGRDMLTGIGLLATVGAVAPFVGLFGTVWGIMNSFIGISQANTTNLAVVAPGIAEALLATALGLVAAIPAVVIYNHFTRKIAGVKSLIADSAAAVMRLLSRDLDRDITLQAVSPEVLS